jgi:tetratricopeptide (TPR) repeat protein
MEDILMSLKDLVHEFLNDPEISDDQKDGIRDLWESHLIPGKELEKQGHLREAIQEYAKEHERPIRNHSDAYIVQSSYWFVGRVYRELGDMEKAVYYLEKSGELYKKYKVGAPPNIDLAEIYITQGRYGEAIDLCQELMDRGITFGVQEIQDKARKLKGDAENQDQ